MACIKVSISDKICDHIDRSLVFLGVPLPVGVCLKVSPEGRHIFDWLWFPTAHKYSGCDERWLGLIAQHSFLAVILIFRVLEDSALGATSEQIILDETFEGTL
jgi:hypothetical protein